VKELRQRSSSLVVRISFLFATATITAQPHLRCGAGVLAPIDLTDWLDITQVTVAGLPRRNISRQIEEKLSSNHAVKVCEDATRRDTEDLVPLRTVPKRTGRPFPRHCIIALGVSMNISTPEERFKYQSIPSFSLP